MAKKKYVIVDIDGTVVIPSPDRLKHAHTDWDAFYAHNFDDEPIVEMVELVKLLSRKYEIVYCTDRSEKARVKTLNSFDKLGLPYTNKLVLMRPDDDERNSSIVKQYLLFVKAGIKASQIAFVLDDHNKVVQEFRAMGLTVLQPANNDF